MLIGVRLYVPEGDLPELGRRVVRFQKPFPIYQKNEYKLYITITEAFVIFTRLSVQKLVALYEVSFHTALYRTRTQISTIPFCYAD